MPNDLTASPALRAQVLEMGERARAASRALAKASTAAKNRALLAAADALVAREKTLLAANAKDVKGARAEGRDDAFIDRLKLTAKAIEAMAQGLREIANLPDPVGEVTELRNRPSGIKVGRMRVPLGVIAIIYESRPNVTADAAVLCAKTGNATILRGGSESIESNVAIAAALSRGGAKAGLPADAILLIPVTDREAVRHLCEMDQFLDCIVPRGGKGLIETVVKHARMPVIKHYDGICAMYAEAAADPAMVEALVLNGKVQRPGVCNAVETLLIHAATAEKICATTGKALLEKNVQLRCDDRSFALLSPLHPALVVHAKEEDYRTEFLDLILAVKIVDSTSEAVEHIESHGSHHSDCIITENAAEAEQFLAEVDSATVYWNASTRFTDGGEFGFGAEIGISTDKLHARGPMALEELTTYKYVLRGTGQVRG